MGNVECRNGCSNGEGRGLHAMDEAIDNLEGVNYEGRSFTFKKEETNQVIKFNF